MHILHVRHYSHLVTKFTDSCIFCRYYSPQSFTDGAINPCMQSSMKFVDYILDALIAMHEVSNFRLYFYIAAQIPQAVQSMLVRWVGQSGWQ